MSYSLAKFMYLPVPLSSAVIGSKHTDPHTALRSRWTGSLFRIIIQQSFKRFRNLYPQSAEDSIDSFLTQFYGVWVKFEWAIHSQSSHISTYSFQHSTRQHTDPHSALRSGSTGSLFRNIIQQSLNWILNLYPQSVEDSIVSFLIKFKGVCVKFEWAIHSESLCISPFLFPAL